jgi:hypothetical protein
MALVGSSKRDGGGMEEFEGLMEGLKLLEEENCGVAWKTSVGDGGKVVLAVGKLFSTKPRQAHRRDEPNIGENLVPSKGSLV